MSKKRTINYRWIVLIVMMIPTFLGQFQRSCTGVIRGNLMEVAAMTGTQYGLLGSMFFYPYVIMQIPAGFLNDKLGARRVLAIGTILTGLGSFLFAMTKSFGGLCLARAIIGIGSSFAVGSVQKVNAAWFKDTQITTVGAWTSPIGYFGGVVAKAPLVLIVGALGLQSTFLAVGAVSVIAGILCYLFIRNTPADAGVPEEDVLAAGITIPKSMPKMNVLETIKLVFKNRLNTWLFIVMPMVMGTYLMFASTWGEPYLEDAFGMTEVEASTLTMYLMIGNILANVVFPIISDRQKKRKPMLYLLHVIGCLLWGLLVFGGIAIKPLLPVICFTLGFTSAPVPLLMSLVREYNPRPILGISIGVCNTFGMSASAIFPLVCGIIMDRLQAGGLTGLALYEKAFIFPFVCAVIALVGTIFLKETNCKNIN